jgi:hypothetical protein
MKKDDVKAVLGRVLSWPPDDQEKVARFVREVEQRRADDDIGEEEWEIIEARAARRDLATDKEVEQVFARDLPRRGVLISASEPGSKGSGSRALACAGRIGRGNE